MIVLGTEVKVAGAETAPMGMDEGVENIGKELIAGKCAVCSTTSVMKPRPVKASMILAMKVHGSMTVALCASCRAVRWIAVRYSV